MLGLEGEVDDHDRVLLDDADQQNNADHAQHRQVLPAHDQRQQRAKTGGRQGRDDGQRVNRAFVQHAEHDVHGDDRRQNQPRLGFQRILKRLGGALETATHAVRHANRQLRLLQGINRLAQGMPRRQVEGQGDRRENALVVDDDRHLLVLQTGQQVQRHHGPTARPHIQMPQGFQGQLPLGVDFENHMVLVQLGEQGCHLALPEGVVQHVINGLHRNAHARGGGAVDLKRGLGGGALLVRCRVLQLRQGFQLVQQHASPVVQFRGVGVLQGVLVLGLAGAATDLDILVGLHIHLDPGHGVQLCLQTGNHLTRRGRAFGERLEVDHHLALADGRVRTDPVVDLGHGRVLADDIGQQRHLLAHGFG